MKKILLIIMAVFLSSCVNNYEKFYKPNPIQQSTQDYIERLKDGQEPKIIFTTRERFKDESTVLQANGYIALGSSIFVGPRDTDPEKHMLEQAKKVGASIVFVVEVKEGVVSSTTTSLQANNISTSYSGTYGQPLGSALSTYYTPVTTISSYEKIHQEAYFLAKYTKKLKLGIQHLDLTEKLKRELGRNTGALVSVVYNDTPAFYSNILKGDIVLAINNQDVMNASGAINILNRVFDSDPTSLTLLILRNNKEIEVEVNLQ